MFRTRLVLIATTPDNWVVAESLQWAPPGPLVCGLALGRDACAALCQAVMVPGGTPTDLASIPRFLRNLPFLDPNGVSRRPAVLHDYLYRGGTLACGRRPTRAEADALLYQALRAEGASRSAATIIWLGVRARGRAAFIPTCRT